MTFPRASSALSRFTVLDLTRIRSGPTAVRQLADWGANVIKIDAPTDLADSEQPGGPRNGPDFQNLHRNKRAMTLNLKDPKGLEVFKRLAAKADVIVENFRPDVKAKLGIDYASMRAINPRLVYASISGFGPEGPDRDRPAFDTVAQAASGFLRLLVNPAHPRVVGPAIADALTGFYAAYGILAALHERNSTGKGRLVETSMFESMAHFNLDDFTHYFSEGLVMGPSSRPHVSQSYVFECHDGKWLALHMSSPPKFWENLANAVGRPDMLHMPQFATRDARIENYEHVIAFLAPIFAEKPRDVWCAELQALEVPHSPVRTSQEVAESAQAQALGMILTDPDGPKGPWRTVRSPVSFDGERMTQVSAPPVLGADNETIVASLRGKVD